MIRYRIEELMSYWEHINGKDPGWLTYRKLSKMSHVSVGTLQRMTHGKTQQISHEVLEKLLDFFCCDINDLIERIK